MLTRLLLAALFCLLTLGAHAETLTSGILHLHFQPEDREIAAESLSVLESALKEFDTRLPAGQQPIHITIAHTDPEFLALTGRRGTHLSGLARSWEGQIVVKAPRLRRLGEDYRGTLRHELVHVLLYRNANTDIMPQWLNEGVAMMMANEVHWQASLTVAQMYLRGRLIDYRHLGAAFQAPDTPGQMSDAYAQALSMTEFLRDEFGEETLWRIIFATREMSFGDALRQEIQLSPLEFWSGYKRSLWAIALVGTLVSGSLFTPAAVLFLFVYAKKRRQRRRDLARMEAEEREEDEGPRYYTWTEILGDQEDWRGEEEDEEEPEHR